MRGTGTASDPYLVATEAELNELRNYTSAHFRLTTNIVLTQPWVPFDFSGTLNGDGYRISGLQVNAAANVGSGFFGNLLADSEVRNLILQTNAVGVVGNGVNYSGVLAGNVNARALILRVVCLGKLVTGGDRAGGFIGRLNEITTGPQGWIRECASFVQITGGGASNRLGTFVGFAYPGWASAACFTSTTYAGGGLANGTPANMGSGVTNLATAAIQLPASYVGWDFVRRWQIQSGFPGFIPPPAPPLLYSYSLPDQGHQVTVDCSVVEGGQPRARRVLAFTEAQITVTVGEVGHLQPVVLGLGVTSQQGLLTLDLDGYEGEVFLVALDDWGRRWSANLACAIGDVLRPSGSFAGVIYECIAAGNTGTTEPVWWPAGDSNDTGTAGTAVFKARQYRRPLAHGPIAPTVSSP
ncbi:hypothetical protein D9M70_296690 [compost metagenome]